MNEQLLDKTYQNFYINNEGIICGIETPKSRWKLDHIQYKNYLKNRISRFENNKVAVAMYPDKLAKLKKMLKQLNAAIAKI